MYLRWPYFWTQSKIEFNIFLNKWIMDTAHNFKNILHLLLDNFPD